MPEMPEVETVRRGLMRIAAGRQIKGIDVNYGKTIENDVEEFRQALIGQTIERIDRRGKYLLFRFSNDLTMVSHLRMEGSYFNQPTSAEVDKHTHVIFHFTDGTDLCYRDTRNEVLWQTQINPEQPANSLTDDQIKRLRENIIAEIARATAGHGTTVHTFKNAFGDAGQFQNELQAYGHSGDACPRCGTKLVKIKVAQRGTTFCPHCQALVEPDD